MYSSYKYAIGIYLGTTDSCVGVWTKGQVNILPDSQGNRSIKSCVAWNGQDFIVGNEAYRYNSRQAKNCIFDIRMLIGKSFRELMAQKAERQWPFEIESDENERPILNLTHNGASLKLYPEQIYAVLIAKLKNIADITLNFTIVDAAISVPATFNYAQREATKLAATMAGLKDVRLIKEPLAAVIPSEMKDSANNKKCLAIVSVGRTKAEICILKRSHEPTFEVNYLNCCLDVNGDVFDKILVDHCVQEFKQKANIGNFQIPAWSLKRLSKDCEKAKKILSFSQQTTIETSDLYEGRDFSYVLTRKVFEELCDNAFQKIQTFLDNSLKDAEAEVEGLQIHKVLMIGGSVQIPKLMTLISDSFKGIEHEVLKDFHESIAGGAAVQAAARAFTEDMGDFLVFDAIGRSFGFEGQNGELVRVIPRNKFVPAKEVNHFKAFRNGQNERKIKIYEGEEKFAQNNLLIQELVLDEMDASSEEDNDDVVLTLEMDAHSHLTVKIDKRLQFRHEKHTFTSTEIKQMITQLGRFNIENRVLVPLAKKQASI